MGFACTVPLAGRHTLRASLQMHNRGNGKGGGIAAVGLDAAQMRVDERTLREDYLLQIAYLDETCRPDVEEKFVCGPFEVHQAYAVAGAENPRALGLEVRPPLVWRYFVRTRPAVLDEFLRTELRNAVPRADAEDEFVFRNSFQLNREFYASLGEKRAFVLSHGKNLLVFKVVGYAEQAVQFYGLEDLRAHIWIAHQRYPTKGRVWHPGGAHPFIGLHQALVHNGDFANYHSITEYLAQRDRYPLFLTDTEVAALLFDLWKRVYGYPMEYVIEALAPTTERDFAMLPPEKREIYRAIQRAHIHGSPDGPWFFILAANDPRERGMQLIGITDTSMLRPQVFALYRGEVEIGLIASEKQAIDATLQSLAAEDPRFCPVADRYWNARGGSHTDGGSFLFTLVPSAAGLRLSVTDKFGREVDGPAGPAYRRNGLPAREIAHEGSFESFVRAFSASDYEAAEGLLRGLVQRARSEPAYVEALDWLTRLRDRRHPPLPGDTKRRCWIEALVQEAIERLLDMPCGRFRRIDWKTRASLRLPEDSEVLVVDAEEFPPEGPDSVSRFLVNAYRIGWRRAIVYRTRGHRFLGCGLGKSDGFRLDVYGSPGDYLASGLDGGEVHVHAWGQDQLAQILRRGKLVVYGSVGQTFMYGAKGGEVYIEGNAAGRPLINGVGRPRVVINGTCLDYLAESFMAGDPLRGGGFVILNGFARDDGGEWIELDTPYPGGNLFSLASGGAIYVRDPRRRVEEGQLNGGRLGEMTEADWALVRPCLEENERLFGLPIDRLLTVDGVRRKPDQVYRKVAAVGLSVLGVSYEGE